MAESDILFEVKDGLGVITLNRPKALNALTHGMILEIEKVIPQWEKDPAVKAVILRGAGDRAFCAACRHNRMIPDLSRPDHLIPAFRTTDILLPTRAGRSR